MRRFNLVRMGDISGNSGVGIVAEGAEARNGKAIIVWFGGNIGLESLGMYDSVEILLGIHGHEGRTVIEYIDPCHDNRQSAANHDVVLIAPPATVGTPQSLLSALTSPA